MPMTESFVLLLILTYCAILLNGVTLNQLITTVTQCESNLRLKVSTRAYINYIISNKRSGYYSPKTFPVPTTVLGYDDIY